MDCVSESRQFSAFGIECVRAEGGPRWRQATIARAAQRVTRMGAKFPDFRAKWQTLFPISTVLFAQCTHKYFTVLKQHFFSRKVNVTFMDYLHRVRLPRSARSFAAEPDFCVAFKK
jgi:hypothetical protein